MAKKKNFYAVKVGFDKETNTVIENQIYQTWAETERVVAGVSKKLHGVSPEYAGFVTRQEAEDFLEEDAAYIQLISLHRAYNLKGQGLTATCLRLTIEDHFVVSYRRVGIKY